MPEIKTIILAAGKGKRMHSPLPKVLHLLCGLPLIGYVVSAAKGAGSKQVWVVTSKEKPNLVARALKKYPGAKIVFQPLPLGTGHAVATCASVSALKKFNGYVLILYGDAPLVQAQTLKKFVAQVREENAVLGFVTAVLSNPVGYGRVIRGGRVGRLSIVEEKELTEEEKEIDEVNIGIYCVRGEWLFDALKKLKPHPITKEYYLTDIVEMASQEEQRVVAFKGEGEEEFLGINDPAQLSVAQRVMQRRLVQGWMAKGVSFVDPYHVYFEAGVSIGEGSLIHPQVYLQGKTRVGKNCVVECGAVLRDMILGDNVHIKPYCVLEESIIKKGAQVGPFARIRPDSLVGEGARVGNFVELKKTKLGPRVRANHLSYLGDAVVGEASNIGCGTITCNYDGRKKHPTKIGKKVFVGSDVQFVAPIRVGDGAYIGAGSTITQSVPSKALAIARAKQVNKKGWVKKKAK